MSELLLHKLSEVPNWQWFALGVSNGAAFCLGWFLRHRDISKAALRWNEGYKKGWNDGAGGVPIETAADRIDATKAEAGITQGGRWRRWSG